MTDSSQSTEPDGRGRSDRSRRTRSALVAAAMRVFGDVGFTDATISSISASAGVSHGTFYTHFQSKEEIFREVISWINAEEIRHRRDEPAVVPATVGERIARTNRQFFETYQRHARVLASYEELAARDQQTSDLRRSTRDSYIERTTSSIRRWQGERLVPPELDAEALAHCLGSMVERVAHMQYVFGEGCDDERMLAAISHVWSTALDLDETQR